MPSEPQPPPQADTYVALGDSYSSGEGLYPYLPGSDEVSPRNVCHRSADAYGPLLDAHIPELGELIFGACSGAVTDDFYVANPSNSGELRQLDRLRQQQNVKNVTLTIGGNDVGFVEVLTRCIYGPGAGKPGCAKDRRFVNAIEARIKTLATGNGRTPKGRPIHALHTLLADIHQAAPKARILMANYPRLFGDPPSRLVRTRRGKACRVGTATKGPVTVSYHISVDDINWINELGRRLNLIILNEITAAQRADIPVTFVPASREFLTHGLCDRSTPWLNGLLIDPEAQTPPQSGSFHPTEVGQRRGYEAAIRKKGIG